MAAPAPSRIDALAAPRPVPVVATAANPAATSLALLATDAGAVLLASWLGVSLWSLVNPGVNMSHYFHLGLSLALFLGAYLAFGLYAPAGLGPVEELRRLVLATVLVALVLSAAVFLAKAGATYSRGAFVVSGALISLLVPAARAALRAACAPRAWWGVPVLILGAGTTGRLLVGKLRAQPELGFKPVACLDDDPARHGECAGVPVPGPLSLAPRLAEAAGIRHLVAAMPGVERKRLVAILERYAAQFSSIIVIPNLFGVASLWVTPHDLGGFLGLELRQNLLGLANRFVKRLVDLILASLLGLLALPVLAVAAIWIRRVSPGPVFYSQQREGKNGSRIVVRKLRTMRLNSDEILTGHLEASPSAREEWTRYFKLRDDPRVLPRIGHWLRRTSLDELPQLWSVLRGEMSLVGPRPFPAYHLDQFEPEFRALRSQVRPGLTGLWQVAARSNGDLEVQRELDTYYIRNWSLWLELHILARTLAVVLRARGAY
ncbi:MAG: undecaprenyl-phosphate galactose phosphotransferase WbaP [Bryobacteraceae bacterium]|nr:undecaprenyl-phosphate galactose phosphotransferase WbaP [Bryobacteraceae bacterium]